MNKKIKFFLAQILFVFFIACFSNSCVLFGMKPKPKQDLIPYGWTFENLPDEILVQIVFFMFGDNHGKAILTMSLVSKSIHEKIIKNKIYNQFFPGLLGQRIIREQFLPNMKPETQEKFTEICSQGHLPGWFIRGIYKKKVPRISFYLIVRGTETIRKNSSGSDDFLQLIVKKGYRTLEYLIPAYGIAKKGTAIKTFLYKQIDGLLTAFADEIDENKALFIEDGSVLDKYQNRDIEIDDILMAYNCFKQFSAQKKKSPKKISKIISEHYSQ